MDLWLSSLPVDVEPAVEFSDAASDLQEVDWDHSNIV
jgi:hypothetical protein